MHIRRSPLSRSISIDSFSAPDILFIFIYFFIDEFCVSKKKKKEVSVMLTQIMEITLTDGQT